MDSTRFAQIARHLTTGATRRGLLARLSALPLGVALATLGEEESEAGRRKRRKARHRRRKNRRQRNRKRNGKGNNKGKNKNKDKGRSPICGACTDTQLCDEDICQDCDVCASGCLHTAVQPAVEAATSGGTVRICPGFYAGNITVDKNLHLIGAKADDTVLLAVTGTVVTVTSGSVVTFDRLQLAESEGASQGGGLHNRGTATLTDCTVKGASAQDGGGIYNDNGTLTLTNCTVLENHADSDGGGIYTNFGSVTLSNSTVTDNRAGEGGGIFNFDGVVALTSNSSVAHNQADDQGGGISNATGTLTLTNSSVTNNHTDSNLEFVAGGIHNGTGTVTLTNSEVTDNTPRNCSGAVPGCNN